MLTATALQVDPDRQATSTPFLISWRGALAVVAPAAVLTALVPSLLLGLTGSQSARWIGGTVSGMHSVIAVVAGVVILRSSRRLSGRSRRAWVYLGGGTVVWGLSNAGWMVDMVTGPTAVLGLDWLPPFTAANAILLVGAVSLPSSRKRIANIRRIDTAIVMVAATGLLWVLPLNRLIAEAADRDGTLLYTALGVIKVATVLVAMGVFVRCRPDVRNETKPLAFGLVILGIADLIFASSSSDGYTLGNHVADALYTAALLLLLLTGIRLGGPPAPRAHTHSAGGRTPRIALPELATVASLVSLAAHTQFDAGPSTATLLIGCTVVALAILRLGLLEHEQRELLTSLRRSAHTLHEQARLDALTGLGNRLALDEHLEHALQRRPDNDGEGVAVFFIDLDHFKRFNDGLGHHVGDRLLVEVAGRLRDVIGDTVHRVGGDEFVAVRGQVDQATAELLAQDVVSVARVPVAVDGHELNCSVSVGLAHLVTGRPTATGDDATDDAADDAADVLLRRADLALFNAKERGRDRWRLYDPRLQHQADARLAMQQGLHRAIERSEIEVHYQPVVELATRRVVGVSASPRWNSPDHGLLLPQSFMPAVIDGGLLPHIGTVLFDDIARMISEVSRDETAPRWVSTPISRDELVHPGFVDRLVGALRTAEVGSEHLRLEVSEDTVVDAVALRVIHELRDLGVHLTVHRFGTGPSSLLSLGQYPASTITVDPSFIEGIGRRRDDTLIVTAVAGLTADLGLELAADGITEEFQAAMLDELGCSLGQGRLFGEHLPRSALEPMPEAVR